MQSTRITNDEDKRREFKSRAAQKVADALVPKQITASATPIDVEVPSNFFQIPERELFGMLQQRLGAELAVEAVEQLMGRTPGKSQFRIILQDPVVQEIKVVSKPVRQTPVVKVDLPTDFAEYRKKEQYAYLTKERAMAPEQANDIIDILEGRDAIGHAVYELSYSEAVQFPNPIDAVKAPPAPITVTLAYDFPYRNRASQEMTLTRDYGLSLVEARDVLKAMDSQPVDRVVNLTIQPPPVVAPKPIAELPEIEVELPHNFAGFRPQDQYMYLKMQQKLTEDQANDVLSVFRGGTPFYNKVTIKTDVEKDYQNPLATRVEEILDPITLSLPYNFASIKRAYQEMALTKEYGLSLSEAKDVVSVINNQPVNREVNITFEAAPVAAAIVEKDFPELKVEIPSSFATLADAQRYVYLTIDLKLTADQANDVISTFNGRTPLYYKVFIDEVADPAPPVLPKKVEVPVAPINLILSHDFVGMKKVYQEIALTKDYGLSLADARDVIATLNQVPVQREINLTFETAPTMVPVVQDEFPEIVIELPEVFGSLVEAQRYAYLVKNAQLTARQANDVLAAYNGNSPLYSKVIIKEAE